MQGLLEQRPPRECASWRLLRRGHRCYPADLTGSEHAHPERVTPPHKHCWFYNAEQSARAGTFAQQWGGWGGSKRSQVGQQQGRGSREQMGTGPHEHGDSTEQGKGSWKAPGTMVQSGGCGWDHPGAAPHSTRDGTWQGRGLVTSC